MSTCVARAKCVLCRDDTSACESCEYFSFLQNVAATLHTFKRSKHDERCHTRRRKTQTQAHSDARHCAPARAAHTVMSSRSVAIAVWNDASSVQRATVSTAAASTSAGSCGHRAAANAGSALRAKGTSDA